MASSVSSKLLVIGDADKVSRLPQEIKFKILSFLSIVDAARIGLSSTTWRAIFCSLSKLAFDYYQFLEIENNLDSFVNFIDQTFSHLDQSSVQVVELHLLRLAYGIPIKKEWITFATQHNTEKLVLYGTIEKLPDCLFLCKSLVKLELAVRNLLLTFPGTFSLPKLQKLKLKLLVLSESALGQDVFSTFPALEKLSIIFCSIQHYKIFSLSSSKLTDFTMCSCAGMESCSFRLQAPFLSKFIYISVML